MQQPLQVITAPAVIMTRELHDLAKGRPPEDFRTASLGIPVLKHHALEVILRLGISIPEKRGLLGFTDDVGNAEVVAVNGHKSSKWVSGPSPWNYAEKSEDQSGEKSCQVEVLTRISSSHGPMHSCRRFVDGDCSSHRDKMETNWLLSRDEIFFPMFSRREESTSDSWDRVP